MLNEVKQSEAKKSRPYASRQPCLRSAQPSKKGAMKPLDMHLLNFLLACSFSSKDIDEGMLVLIITIAGQAEVLHNSVS